MTADSPGVRSPRELEVRWPGGYLIGVAAALSRRVAMIAGSPLLTIYAGSHDDNHDR
jgi:hypothetical protein